MIKLDYTLNSREIEESLLCLSWKKEGIYKKINVCILILLTLLSLISYINNSHNFYYIVFAYIGIFFIFLELYLSSYMRKKKSERIASKQGIYKIEVCEDGFNLNSKNLKYNEFDSVAIISENVITIKCNKNILCIPKRILSKQQAMSFKDTLRKNCNYIEVKTGRSLNRNEE